MLGNHVTYLLKALEDWSVVKKEYTEVNKQLQISGQDTGNIKVPLTSPLPVSLTK